MDYTILYVIGIILVSLAFLIGIRYAKSKGLVSDADLQFTIQALSLTSSIVAELNLKQEKQISAITGIILVALEKSVESIGTNDVDKLKDTTKQLAYSLCARSNIELTDNRKAIIDQLVGIGIQNKYIK